MTGGGDAFEFEALRMLEFQTDGLPSLLGGSALLPGYCADLARGGTLAPRLSDESNGEGVCE